MAIRVAVVEDEQGDVAALADCLNRYSEETGEKLILKNFSSGFYLLDGYTDKYDVVLLDIEMPGINGIDTAKKLREFDRNVYIIFITNMAQYAIQGYKVSALDYFLKPVRYYDLKMRLDRIRSETSVDDLTIAISFRGGLKRFKTCEIYYIESVGHKIIFHNSDGEYEARGRSMRELEEQLTPYGFFRCNTSFIVNLSYCAGVNGLSVKVADTEIPVSRDRKKKFMERLAENF